MECVTRAEWTRRARDASGQTLTEYVLVTGMLALMGIALSGIVSAGLRTFVRSVALAVRTIAP